MAKATLVVTFPLEAGKQVVDLLEENGIPVSAAFWYYKAAYDEWKLYISSKLTSSLGTLRLYDRVYKILDEAKSPPDMDRSDIVIVSSKASIMDSMRWTAKVLRGEPGRLVRGIARNEDDPPIDEAYVYRLT